MANRSLSWRSDESINRRYAGSYPLGLDLRPGSDKHDQILTMVLEDARESESYMSPRFPVWDRLDDQLNVYVNPDELEQRLKSRDHTKPIQIVVPESYATLDTLLTYSMTVFGEDPLLRYEGAGPEDTLGAILLEKVIATQSRRKKHLLALHTCFRDAFAYGFGAMHIRWDVEMGKTLVPQPLGYFDPFSGEFIEEGTEMRMEDSIKFEGNTFEPINPRNCLPDPSVPIYEAQKGAFFGWVERTNYYNLLRQEALGGQYIYNVRWLETLGDGEITSSIYAGQRTKHSPDRTGSHEPTRHRSVDVVWLYKEIIPSEEGWGDSDMPEKWVFGIAGDAVVIAAHPMELTHNLFPIAVMAPDYDGHTLLPISKLEIGYGLQEFINYSVNSRMVAIRKMLLMRLLADPKAVNMKALLKGAPVVPTRPPVWGRGVKDLVDQIKMDDTTLSVIQDAGNFREMHRTATGAVDAVQGIQRQRGERVTAAEFEATRGSALSRLQRASRVMSLQGVYDAALISAHHTQQFLTEDTYVKIAGRWEQDLRHEFGITDAMVPVRPSDLNINFDIEIQDGSIEGGSMADQWGILFQTLTSNQELMMAMDVPRIFLHIARLMGAKNAHEFLRKVPEARAQVQGDEEVAEMAQRGEVVPVG